MSELYKRFRTYTRENQKLSNLTKEISENCKKDSSILGTIKKVSKIKGNEQYDELIKILRSFLAQKRDILNNSTPKAVTEARKHLKNIDEIVAFISEVEVEKEWPRNVKKWDTGYNKFRCLKQYETALEIDKDFGNDGSYYEAAKINVEENYLFEIAKIMDKAENKIRNN
jgi:hypothetical protein